MKKTSNERYEITARNFWNNVAFMLKKRGMKWKDLAVIIGTKENTLTSRKAQNSNVSIGNALEISEALDTSVDRLLYGNPRDLSD